ncbi:MAG: hypothetical protein GF334_03140 [Candidatus Altiarchaeales archaeon]|nr:hypothetical protein [Candidatus Altiarchaeales archaeon]
MLEEKHHPITRRMLVWDVIVFTAVIVSIISVSLEFLLRLEESQLYLLLLIDVAAVIIFAIDLMVLWKHSSGGLKEFMYRNWLDVLAAIPLFRIIRIARFARLLKLARLRRVAKLRRVAEVEEKIRKEKVV